MTVIKLPTRKSAALDLLNEMAKRVEAAHKSCEMIGILKCDDGFLTYVALGESSMEMIGMMELLKTNLLNSVQPES